MTISLIVKLEAYLGLSVDFESFGGSCHSCIAGTRKDDAENSRKMGVLTHIDRDFLRLKQWRVAGLAITMINYAIASDGHIQVTRIVPQLGARYLFYLLRLAVSTFIDDVCGCQ
jgi:hypothetical protein